jgi:diguanylate cyclase (GGDEF)-like protein
MIFPSLYEELDMKRYAKLAVNMLPQRNIMVALCDESGQLVWSSEENKALAELIVNSNERHYVDSANSGCDYVERKHNGINVVCCHLGELAGRPAGEVLFYDIGDEVNGKNGSGHIVPMLCSIAEIVKAELHYLYEVNAMARELGERYDELSMLRTSDLELTEYRESRHILSTYIRSCAEHLSVDYAAIWISTRQSIHPGGVSYKPESGEILSLLESLSIAAYAMFQEGHDGFGINDKDEELRRIIQLPADKKVLLVPVLDAKGKPCGVLSCLNEFYNKDFTNSDKSTLEAVSHKTHKYLLSTQDELTGLLNRKGFEETLWREIAQTESERYLVLFNIDQFTVVNAAYGMTTGDIVLTSIADTISKPSLGIKFTARLDADVFATLIEASESEIESLVSNICNEIDSMAIPIDGKMLTVKSRAGVIALNSKETALADHFYAAELALSSAKEESNNRVVVYHPGNTALLKRKHQLTQVENIKNAIEEDRFVLYCQRIAPLSGDESHYEILVRMIDESGELVMPDEFIPVAERYNLMNQVDRWIIKHTFQLLCKEEYRDLSANFKWGINLSGMTISDPDFHDYVSSCLREYDFLATNLYFEITETAAIKNFQHCVSFMNKIHSLGVQFALDDFGSGLSSFSYLKKFSIDYLKIDGSLVKDIVGSRLDQTMVSAISDIAKVLKVKTIAEYVENDSILEVISGLNIDYAQGYGIMKPQAIELELKSLAEQTECKRYSNH